MAAGSLRSHSRLIATVGAVLVLDALFFSSLAPLLPRYIEEYSLSSAQAGFLVATDAIGNLATVPVAAWVVGRWGPRRTLAGALLGVAAATLVFGLAQSLWLLDVSRAAAGGMGTFAWAAAFTWLVRTVSPGQRARSIGIVMGSAAAGGLLGPGLGALAAYTSTAALFGAIAIGNVVLGAVALMTPGPDGGVAESLGFAALRGRIGGKAASSLSGLAWLMTLPALVSSVLLVEIPVRLDDLGVQPALIGAVFVTTAVVDMVLSPLVGWWADRRGRLAPLRAGTLVVGLGALALPWLGEVVVVATLTVVVGCGTMLLGGPTLAMLADRFDALDLPYEIGFSSQTLCWSVGHAAGALGTGIIAATTTGWAPLLGVAVLALSTFAGLRYAAGSGGEGAPAALRGR